jgi:hypothetical protein
MGIDGWRTKAGSPGIPMSTPQNLSPIGLEAISEISVAMVEQPKAREVFEDGS